MDRREFCQRLALLGGAAALSPLIKACRPIASSTPTASPYPSSTPYFTPVTAQLPASGPLPEVTVTQGPTATNTVIGSEASARIALVKTADRSAGVHEAIRLLGIDGLNGDSILLKPNFNSADDAPGSTHPETLRALIVELNERGAGSIVVGDRSGMGHTRTVMQKLGVFDQATKFGFDTVSFDELAEEDWIVVRSDEFHWQDGYPVPRLLLEADRVVQTCNLKTHGYGGHFTMALKNSVGLVAKTIGPGKHNYMGELHGSPYQRHMIAEINSAYSPDLIVMDGIEAFVTGGPANGQRVRPEVILAGTDPVAIDAVGVSILRLYGTTPEVSRGRVFDQEQIARAAELELGVDSPERIQIVSSDLESKDYAEQIYSVLNT
jgi:uncharacterized protein (DUF362 family)